MSHKIEIEYINGDNTHRELFLFFFSEKTLELSFDRYAEEERASKTHVWRIKALYERYPLFQEKKTKFLTKISEVPNLNQAKKDAHSKLLSSIKIITEDAIND